MVVICVTLDEIRFFKFFANQLRFLESAIFEYLVDDTTLPPRLFSRFDSLLSSATLDARFRDSTKILSGLVRDARKLLEGEGGGKLSNIPEILFFQLFKLPFLLRFSGIQVTQQHLPATARFD